jgi:hypothetical protein
MFCESMICKTPVEKLYECFACDHWYCKDCMAYIDKPDRGYNLCKYCVK